MNTYLYYGIGSLVLSILVVGIIFYYDKNKNKNKNKINYNKYIQYFIFSLIISMIGLWLLHSKINNLIGGSVTELINNKQDIVNNKQVLSNNKNIVKDTINYDIDPKIPSF